MLGGFSLVFGVFWGVFLLLFFVVVFFVCFFCLALFGDWRVWFDFLIFFLFGLVLGFFWFVCCWGILIQFCILSF